MSDCKDPAEDLANANEEERDVSADSQAAAETAPADADAAADPGESDSEEEAAEELPEGINLMAALIEAQKEAQSNKDGWQRARAEFANYKKRVERERIELFQRAAHDTLLALLPIVDDFDRAFESVPEDISDNPWIGGVSMIQRKFANLLERYEVEAIDPTGQPFDPNLHQAIGTEDRDDVESGHVAQTLQKGYRAGDKVLRLAMVKVAS